MFAVQKHNITRRNDVLLNTYHSVLKKEPYINDRISLFDSAAASAIGVTPLTKVHRSKGGQALHLNLSLL